MKTRTAGTHIKTLTNGRRVEVTRGRGLDPNAPRREHWTVRDADTYEWLGEGATMREALAYANR